VGATVEVTSDKYQTGIILGQFPSAETEIEAGSHVDLFIAKNPKFGLIKMPYLIGKKLEKAEEILNDMKINVAKIAYQETDIIEEGIVMRQEPMWDEEVRVGSSVMLTVSKSP
jgi:serine/threonine-protein kinase